MTTNVRSSEDMRYSPLSYQILPYADEPVPHLFSLKSSVSEVGTVALTFAFVLLLTFAFVVTLALALRLSLRMFTFELLLLVERLANAITMTTRPMPITTSAVSPPSIHQIAFDFFRIGAAVGAGVHCCCGGGGGGGGAVRRGVGVVTGGSGR